LSYAAVVFGFAQVYSKNSPTSRIASLWFALHPIEKFPKVEGYVPGRVTAHPHAGATVSVKLIFLRPSAPIFVTFILKTA
jgi:hypothetical protein